MLFAREALGAERVDGGGEGQLVEVVERTPLEEDLVGRDVEFVDERVEGPAVCAAAGGCKVGLCDVVARHDDGAAVGEQDPVQIDITREARAGPQLREVACQRDGVDVLVAGVEHDDLAVPASNGLREDGPVPPDQHVSAAVSLQAEVEGVRVGAVQDEGALRVEDDGGGLDGGRAIGGEEEVAVGCERGRAAGDVQDGRLERDGFEGLAGLVDAVVWVRGDEGCQCFGGSEEESWQPHDSE